ncbi:unnamed protein product [Rotaria sordida]|uniref:Mediator of RNA polymerase II transcription subunit 28 n=1 Tax=Rotaria sordida TaxID=392033 RepID=A0A814L5V4_9BILA|nr:unnamed protein product [Rotaria sordida]CAF1059866.1 unnamed protein product [Rotaria sordida]
MSSINLSDDLLNNFEESIKSFIAFLLQDPCTGSSSAVASTSTSEHNSASVEQHVRRIYESANEIECNLLQLKALVNRTLPEEQILESITDLRTNIERKETLLREFNQYLNDAIADFSVENTESLNGLLDELSRGITTTSTLTNADLGDNLSQATTATTASQSSLLGNMTLANPTTYSTHFNDIWLQEILTNSEDNYQIKANNLDTILKYIMDYYSKTLNQSLVAENIDEIELSRLLQLVSGCTISILQDEKSNLIQETKQLNERIQEFENVAEAEEHFIRL